MSDIVRQSMSLAATIPAPDALLHPSAEKASALPQDRATRSTSVLPRLKLDDGAIRFEPASGARYVDVKRLGEGGMGEVALVEDRDIGRKVARKRLHPGSRAADIVRFVDEVRTVGRLDHPGIVPIHDVGLDEDGEFFFVMKYVEGETLESVIEKIREGDPNTLAHWDRTRRVQLIASLLKALGYAHQRRILHRDIKPANIMIGRHGEVVLMDWGLARPIGGEASSEPSSTASPSSRPIRASETSAGMLVGTPFYMSPEQAAGANAELDERSDLYAVCLVMLELLSGHHPHESISDVATLLERIKTFEAPTASQIAGDGCLSAECAHFLHRGLQREPSARWPSANEMAEELHAILDGRCRVQCPVTFSKHLLSTVSRNLDARPGLVFGVAALVVVTFVLLASLSAAYLFRS